MKYLFDLEELLQPARTAEGPSGKRQEIPGEKLLNLEARRVRPVSFF